MIDLQTESSLIRLKFLGDDKVTFMTFEDISLW